MSDLGGSFVPNLGRGCCGQIQTNPLLYWTLVLLRLNSGQMKEFPQAACEPEVNLKKGNSMSQENNNPVYRVRLSTISAAVFKNTSADGKAYFNAQFDRSYKDGDEWKHTKSFG